jgi:hypothetical protein
MNPSDGVARALALATTATISTPHTALRTTVFDMEVSFL